MAALLAGQVRTNIIQYQASVLELIRSGRLRALAVTTDGKRAKSLPDTPSI
jgi:tripartite-type tricarboxylate transporter receptor subunit TctC